MHLCSSTASTLGLSPRGHAGGPRCATMQHAPVRSAGCACKQTRVAAASRVSISKVQPAKTKTLKHKQHKKKLSLRTCLQTAQLTNPKINRRTLVYRYSPSVHRLLHIALAYLLRYLLKMRDLTVVFAEGFLKQNLA